MSKFKVGDTIRCIDKSNTSFLQLGKTYTVLNSKFIYNSEERNENIIYW